MSDSLSKSDTTEATTKRRRAPKVQKTPPSAGERSIVVCAIQRTGSTVVIDDLANLAGDYPFDTEYLYRKTVLERDRESWDEIWQTVGKHCHIADFHVNKVMFHYTSYIATVMAGGTVTRKRPIYEFVPEQFDPFYTFFKDSIWVYIEREDIFAQAVSMYFAETIQLWEHRPAKMDKVPERPRVPYDRPRLMQLVRSFAAECAGWEKFFAHYGIDPIRIRYEDTVSDYPGYLNELAAAMKLTPVQPAPPRRMLKVGDATNERFARTLRGDVKNHPILRSILNP
jgi:LPS sulfotransferase NodH